MAAMCMTMRVLYFNYWAKQVLLLNSCGYRRLGGDPLCKQDKDAGIDNIEGMADLGSTKYNLESLYSQLANAWTPTIDN